MQHEHGTNPHPVPDPTVLTQDQIDRQLSGLRERLGERFNELAKMTDQQVGAVRELVEQQANAVKVASEEREKSAVQIRDAVKVASEEREKSAVQLRLQLAQQIEQGDKALRDHIAQQISQLRIMLEATQREAEVRADSQQKAIDKSEVDYTNRFKAVNGLRDQMQELISSHQKALSDLTSSLMPREVAEAKIEDLNTKISANTSRIDRATGKELGQEGHKEQTQFNQTTMISLVVAAVAIIGVIITLASILTG